LNDPSHQHRWLLPRERQHSIVSIMVAITPLPSHEADLAADQPAAAAPPGVATVPELQWCPLCTESVQNLVHCSGCKAGSCLPCLKQWLSCDISKVCPFCRLESVELDEAWAQPQIDAVLAGPREHWEYEFPRVWPSDPYEDEDEDEAMTVALQQNQRREVPGPLERVRPARIAANDPL